MRHSERFRSLILVCAVAVSCLNLADAQDSRKLQLLSTLTGVQFALLGEKGSAPAPALIVFAGESASTLEGDYNKIGSILAEKGFLSVSLDLPCHGKDQRPGEPNGLAGWQARLANGEAVVSAFVSKVSAVLDYLVEGGYADPQKVFACGTSRGGFIALHFAAADTRVRAVAAFAPVTDLLALKEFVGMKKYQATQSLALVNIADKLAGRALWICIGDNDLRVGTDNAIAFSRRVTEASLAARRPANVELHVVPSAGHSIHPTAHQEAAAWILAQLGTVH